jgi:hypothetical protein
MKEEFGIMFWNRNKQAKDDSVFRIPKLSAENMFEAIKADKVKNGVAY